MNTTETSRPQSRQTEVNEHGPLQTWVENAISGASNGQRLKRQLDAIASSDGLLCFLHRFVLFNDALAARVPFLAGLIHLTPNLFLDPGEGVEFCRQANGRVAAYVAEAASDEYRMSKDRNMVHQFLSQRFLRGALQFYTADEAKFDARHPLPGELREILQEARSVFFQNGASDQIFAALGFHVALEFFAHQEFNLVDAHLRANYPDLVTRLERPGREGPNYTWLALHTVVEIGHYRAGLEALNAAVSFCRRADRQAMVTSVQIGFNTFIDLQKRYYEAILRDAG